MKILLIIILAAVLIFTAVQIVALTSQKSIEKYPYEISKVYSDFEIREYEASLFTAVKLSTNDYKVASRRGFSILAGYIFGGNETNETIAMTSPVSMSLDDSMTMMFMVPKNIKKDDLPKPNSSMIKFTEMPAKKVAAIRFSGWANSTKIEKYRSKLINALDGEGIVYSNRFYFLGYNAPYETIKRRNEIIVELD